MEFSFDIPDAVFTIGIPAALMTGMVAAALLALLPGSIPSRERRVERWAARNLVTLTPETRSALDRAILGRRRLEGAALLLAAPLAVPLALFPEDERWQRSGPWMISITLGLVVVLAGSWQLARPWFPVGPARSARSRAVGLEDYVFPPVRWCAWVCGIGCATAVVLVVLSASSTAEAAIAAATPFGVVVAVAVGEWNGYRAAGRPQPARDSVELYSLDAWRCDLAVTGFSAASLFGGYVVAFVAWRFVEDPLAATLLHLAGWGLLLLWAVTRGYRSHNLTWMRHRLWPGLRDGESLGLEQVAR